jgi:hypothetical protein
LSTRGWLGSGLVAGLVLLILLPLAETGAGGLEARHERTRLLFERGFLEESQGTAAANWHWLERENPRAAARFRLLTAESMLFRGMYPDALETVGAGERSAVGAEERIQSLSIASVALVRRWRQRTGCARRGTTRCAGMCCELMEFGLRRMGIWRGRGGNLSGPWSLHGRTRTAGWRRALQ